MIDSLKRASADLHVALERYLKVCNDLFTSHSNGCTPSTPSEEDVEQINAELVTITSHEKNLREARITMNRARNHIFSVSPISSLPPEVLARIFEVVVDSRPCSLTTVNDEAPINQYRSSPDLLAQICSHWRHVAHSHPSLWVHIDFMPNGVQAKLISRAKTYAKRARPMPLEVHIVGAENAQYARPDLVKFLEPLASRMKALNLFVASHRIGEFYSLVLETLIPRSNPVVFTRINLCSQSQRSALESNIWIKSDMYNVGSYAYFTINLPEEVLERSFAPLKSLDLCAIFPNWKSKAYHGLTELRLTSSSDDVYSLITEQTLIAILQASPGLRTLHFAIGIVDQQQGPDFNGPVTLSGLEELEVYASYKFQKATMDVASLLRLLAPGNRPLSLKLQTAEYSVGTYWETIKSFLARSNVTKFHTDTGAPLVDELLRYMPRLTELVFTRISGYRVEAGITADALKQAIREAESVDSHLASLIMRNSSISLYQLQLLVELYPTKSLVLHDCYVWENDVAKEPMSDPQLSQLFPVVKLVRGKKLLFNLDSTSTPTADSDSNLGSDSEP